MTKLIKRLAEHLAVQSGVSIVATTITLLMLSLFLAVTVSLVTTGSNVAVQEVQGVQALYIADGGLQYTVRDNAFPNFGVNPARNLGEGSFTVAVPTVTVDPVRTSPLPTLTISSTEGFLPTSLLYWTMLCVKTNASPPAAPVLNATYDCEKISFAAKPTATTFTTGTRGRDSSALPTAGEAGHPVGSVVLMYSWDTAKATTIATRSFTTLQKCNSAATTLCVTSTANFADSGFVRINNGAEDNIEDVFYRGKGSGVGACGAGCAACLGADSISGKEACIRRAYDGGASGTVNHAAGTTIWQSEISVLPLATGIIPGNAFAGTIQRRIQLAVLPLK